MATDRPTTLPQSPYASTPLSKPLTLATGVAMASAFGQPSAGTGQLDWPRRYESAMEAFAKAQSQLEEQLAKTDRDPEAVKFFERNLEDARKDKEFTQTMLQQCQVLCMPSLLTFFSASDCRFRLLVQHLALEQVVLSAQAAPRSEDILTQIEKLLEKKLENLEHSNEKLEEKLEKKLEHLEHSNEKLEEKLEA